jgi:tRNA 2-selenouridine synthase
MQPVYLSADDFLREIRKSQAVLLDVRSEKEFERGHIPGAVSMPLLNDTHRHEIGTIYKNQGRQAAVLKGFELVGPLFHRLVQDTLKLCGNGPVFLYCWRGGMRSGIMAWLFQMAGLKVSLLKGGYKAYRSRVHEQLHTPLPIVVLGGKTGSGKTEVLNLLKESGEQVIDLEGLACHKGSAFGLLGMPPQPSQEQFENLLAAEVEKLDLKREVWLENESRLIGRIVLPTVIYEAMRAAMVVEVRVERNQREERIRKEYCVFPAADLAEHTGRIKKRLGPQHLKQALHFLDEGDKDAWLKIVLDYYDKTYAHSNSQRNPEMVLSVDFDWESAGVGIRKVINVKSKVIQIKNRLS